MEDNVLYEVTLCNIPFRQAQGLYRFLVNLQDSEEFHGSSGLSWSGSIQSNHNMNRIITISPMPTHE